MPDCQVPYKYWTCGVNGYSGCCMTDVCGNSAHTCDPSLSAPIVGNSPTTTPTTSTTTSTTTTPKATSTTPAASTPTTQPTAAAPGTTLTITAATSTPVAAGSPSTTSATSPTTSAPISGVPVSSGSSTNGQTNPSTSSSSAQGDTSGGSSNGSPLPIGAIIGIALGGFALIALIAACIFLARRRRRDKEEREKGPASVDLISAHDGYQRDYQSPQISAFPDSALLRKMGGNENQPMYNGKGRYSDSTVLGSATPRESGIVSPVDSPPLGRGSMNAFQTPSPGPYAPPGQYPQQGQYPQPGQYQQPGQYGTYHPGLAGQPIPELDPTSYPPVGTAERAAELNSTSWAPAGRNVELDPTSRLPIGTPQRAAELDPTHWQPVGTPGRSAELDPTSTPPIGSSQRAAELDVGHGRYDSGMTAWPSQQGQATGAQGPATAGPKNYPMVHQRPQGSAHEARATPGSNDPSQAYTSNWNYYNGQG